MNQLQTVYIKRVVGVDGLPKESGWYKTEGQDRWFSIDKGYFTNTSLNRSFKVIVEWYLEKIKSTMLVMTEEEIKEQLWQSFQSGASSVFKSDNPSMEFHFREYLNQLSK